MKQYFILMTIFLVSTTAEATYKIQAKGVGGYSHSSFSVTSDNRANFGGSRFGGEAVAIFRNGPYGLGAFAGYRTGTSQNSANNVNTTENLNLKTTYGGGKAYAADAFVEIALAFQEAQISLKNGATATQATYSGFGFHIGLGIDIYFGPNLFVSPTAYYERVDLSQKEASVGSRRFEEGGLNVSLGFAF